MMLEIHPYWLSVVSLPMLILGEVFQDIYSSTIYVRLYSLSVCLSIYLTIYLSVLLLLGIWAASPFLAIPHKAAVGILICIFW